MSFTYTASPLTRDIDAVREEMGDTLEREHLVEDESILYALAKESSVLNAAARLCEQLAVRFASKDSFRVNSAQASKLTVTAKYLELAKVLRAKGRGSGGTGTGGFIMPSLSIAEKEANEEDLDVPQPSFYRGIHANPDTDEDSPPLGSTSSSD